MDFGLLVVEADGSIHNPAVAWAITIWVAIAFLVGLTAGRRMPTVPALILMLVVGLATPFFAHGLARMFYIIRSSTLVAVNFWSFSSLQWLGPGGAILGVAAGRVIRRVRRPESMATEKAG